MPLPSHSLPFPTIDLYTLAGTQDTTATFDEHEALKNILRAASGQFEIEMVCEVQTRRAPFPVFPIFLLPALARVTRLPRALIFFGGIHSLERISSQVVLDYMQSMLCRLSWDELLKRQLEKIRLVLCPSLTQGECGHTNGPTPGRGLDAQRASTF